MILSSMTEAKHSVVLPSLAALITATLLLAGCPLVSDLPLSDPATARIDEALVGMWKAQDPDSGEWRRLTFLPFDEHELVGIAPADKADEVDAFRVFTTRIDGESFLNIRELGTGSSGWYLLRYVMDGKRLVMTLVDDGLFKDRTFAGSAELCEFVRRNASNPLLYEARPGEEGRDMVWERASD